MRHRIGLPLWAALVVGLALSGAGVARAEGQAEVMAAVRELARTTYRWEATERQRVRTESAEPKLDRNAPVAAEGVMGPDGVWQITLRGARNVGVPVTAVFRDGDVVAQTPSGWRRRSELRPVAGSDPEVTIGGRKVRQSRIHAAALQATAQRPPTEELFDLLAEIRDWRSGAGLVIGQLGENAIERLWGDPEARRAPEVQGTVVFRIAEEGLTEVHVALAIGQPNPRTRTTAWTVQQWSTRFSELGTARVELTDEVRAALDAAP